MSRNILQGLVGAWCPTLGPSGYALLDRSVRSNHGTLTNMDAGSDWVSTPSGWALDYDGTNDHVTIGNKLNDVIAGASARFTITQWIRTSQNINQLNVSKLDGGAGQRQFFIRANDDGLDFTWYGALDASSFRVVRAAYQFTTAGWTHIAATFNAQIAAANDKVSLFINGKRQSFTIPFTNGTPVSIPEGTAALAIGCSFTNTVPSLSFNGQIGETAMFSRVLTDAEIWQLYNLGQSGLGRLLTPQRRSYAFKVPAAAVKSYLFVGRGQVIGGGTL